MSQLFKTSLETWIFIDSLQGNDYKHSLDCRVLSCPRGASRRACRVWLTGRGSEWCSLGLAPSAAASPFFPPKALEEERGQEQDNPPKLCPLPCWTG